MYWQLDSRARGNMCLLVNLRWSTASGQTARGFQKKPWELRRAEDAQSATRASQRRSINTRASQIIVTLHDRLLPLGERPTQFRQSDILQLPDPFSGHSEVLSHFF